MVMTIETKNINSARKKTASVIIIWLLIASGIFIMFPLSEPKAGAILYHSNTAQWEDQDFGGGLDYNGDPAGDLKVTWHPANNSHIVNSNFFVNDGYIFELEAGVIVQTDPGIVIQVGTVATGATFYANGTVGNPVMMGPNSSGPWGGIYFVFGSFGFIQSSWIDQGDLLYVEGSTLDVNASAITNMNSFGIFGTVSTVSVTFTAIIGTGTSPGIYALNSDLSVNFCFISDAQSAAIRCDSSFALISNSDLYGFNASAGANGGHAIYVTGISPSVTIIDNNNIIGGSGGPNAGLGGGEGGFGIFDIDYEGQLNVIGNQKILGGVGGNNTLPGSFAGDGGIGIHVIPLSDLALPPSVNVSGNVLIQGGRGGDNDAPSDGSAGNGGAALRLTDSPVPGAGNAYVGYNTDIIGGDGGHNHADAAITGWTAGEGGVGIYVQDVKKPASATIEWNPNIIGGAGGNNTGLGNLITQAGEGGSGILLWNATDVLINQNTITGGHGGNNTITGMMARAGDGGNGVFLYYPNSMYYSAATIYGCIISGGEGGDDWVGMAGPGMGGPGTGGSGIYSSQGSGICTISIILGGKGGDNFGPMGFGGMGGYGTGIFSSFAWSFSGGSIIGGKGGSNYDIIGGGGGGSYGVVVSNSNGVSFSLISPIIGGNGGDADIGNMGPGNAVPSSVYVSNSYNLTIMRSDIRVGTGGYNASSGEYGQNGTICIYTDAIGGANTILGNDITTNLRGGNTYGIRLNIVGGGTATVEGNDIYTNYIGVYVLASPGAEIGSGNNIYDNDFGVYFFSSDAIMGPNNVINDNGYGVYCYDSSPTITGDLITNSSTIGMFFTFGSNPVIEDCTIGNSNVWNVYSEAGGGGGSSPQFYNSTLVTKAGAGEFYQTGNSHPWLLNTTFDKTKTGFGDSVSNITVNWYMHILVVDTSFLPVSAATVWVNDSYGTNLFMLSTDVMGWADWNIVTEYIENTTGYEYYYTPHNVSAWEGGRFGNTKPDMTLSRVVIIMLDGISMEIPLKFGWNMISIPLDQPSSQLEDVLSAISGRYAAVQWYNVSDSADPWKHYHISKPSNLNDLSDIDKTIAIWILMDMDNVLPIVGPIPVPPTTDIQLKTGWNFVGYPSITPLVAGNASGEAFETISGFVDMVQYYDAFDSGDYWKEWDPGSMSPDDLTDIEPGMGLWIHVNSDCTWTVDW
jgi:hypothetical protein